MKHLLEIVVASMMVHGVAYAQNVPVLVVDTVSMISDCESLFDVEEKFPVEGTRGDGRRSCEWASRRATKYRCNKPIVREKCPITCNAPCNSSKGGGPTITAISNAEIAEAPKDVPVILIVILSLSFIAAGTFVTAFILNKGTQGELDTSKDGSYSSNSSSSLNVPGYDVPGPDDQSIVDPTAFAQSKLSIESDCDSENLLNENKEIYKLEINVPVVKPEQHAGARQDSISTQEALKMRIDKCKMRFDECPC